MTRMVRPISLLSRGASSGSAEGSLLIVECSLRETEEGIISKTFLQTTYT